VGLPDEFVTAAMIPLGWPLDGYAYGPTTRKPASTVTHWEKWGNQKGG
jgi:nitroreductase